MEDSHERDEDRRRTIIWVAGVMGYLVEHKLLGGDVKLTPKGVSEFDQMVAEGFTPDPALVVSYLGHLAYEHPDSRDHMPHGHSLMSMIRDILDFRSIREFVNKSEAEGNYTPGEGWR